MPEALVVAITGANGYVGSVIAAALAPVAKVIRLVRRPQADGDVAWSFACTALETEELLRAHGITHLVHAAWDMSARTLAMMNARSVAGSYSLFAGADAAGIKRLVFISTISAFDGARSAYGLSKLAVESLAQSMGGVVLRLGLVYGTGDGGMYGRLRASISSARIVPMIGDGRTPQYLLDEVCLGDVVRRAMLGDFDGYGQPLTIAEPQSVVFSALLRQIAADEHRKVMLLPVPWWAIYSSLKLLEICGLKPDFRSDSVLSFVHQNPTPDFGPMRHYGIDCGRFSMLH